MMSPSLSNNAAVFWGTNASYTGGENDLIASTVPGIFTGLMSNIPYTTNDLLGTSGAQSTSPLVTGRLVSAGMRVSYIGTALNKSGIFTTITTPDHENVNGQVVSTYAEACIVSQQRVDSVTVQASGIDTGEVEYSNDASLSVAERDLLAIWPYCAGNAINGVDTYNGAPIMKVSFSGVPGQSFYVEFIEHIEYVGSRTSHSLTPSHTDARGFEMVQQAASQMPARRAANPLLSAKRAMSDGLRDAAHALAPGVNKMIRYGTGRAAYAVGGRVASAAGSAMLALL